MTTITLSKGGTAEREADINTITIPDCWHSYERLLDIAEGRTLPPDNARHHAAMVLELWHLAHDLKRHIQDHVSLPREYSDEETP